MKRITTIALLLLFMVLEVKGQAITDLYGFRLGQFKETAANELGEPFQEGELDDGYKYQAFIIKSDSNSYMIFGCAPEQADIIRSIQISERKGKNATTDTGFKGLKLGTSKKQVEQMLGKPDEKKDIGDYGELWSYDERANYSIEIGTNGKLSSVKIWDIYSDDTPDVTKLPKFKNVIKLMSSKNNVDMASILAPGIEIYYKDQTLFFNKSLKTEIETDESKVFQTIREISVGLNKINTSDPNSYEENIRLVMGQNPKHVVKIKTGHIIKEIVFEYTNKQFLIWEINAL